MASEPKSGTCCASRAGSGDLCRELSQHYEADIDALTRDVTMFLQALIERGLVRVVDAGSPVTRP
jgi:hypothetical protein